MDNNQFLSDWGLTIMVFLPLAGALVMLLIPRTEEQVHKRVALAEPGRRRHRRGRHRRLRLRGQRHDAVRGRTSVDRRDQQPLRHRHRRPVDPLVA
jgi:hypothetical protein